MKRSIGERGAGETEDGDEIVMSVERSERRAVLMDVVVIGKRNGAEVNRRIGENGHRNSER